MVRLSGPRAFSCGRKVFLSNPPLGKRIRRVEYGRVLDSEGREIDTGLAWGLCAPHSYTGEDTVEITCHGSALVLEILVQSAIAHGAVLAAPGEFTRRAFFNGRLDLLQAEAVIDLIQAGSRGALDNAYGQASGKLSELIRVLKSRVVRALSLIEIGLDFVEEEEVKRADRELISAEIGQSLEWARRLVDTFEGSRRRQSGFLVALIGRPNTGKSTLLNALLGEERAIVTEIPGTTRDLVEGRTVWAGETVRLVDTAGIRLSSDTSDTVERAGIDRARHIALAADLILGIFDASQAWQKDDDEVVALLLDRPGLVVLNKTDLPRRLRLPRGMELPRVEISALRGRGLNALQQKCMDMKPLPVFVEGLALSRQRHHDRLLCAIEHIQSAHNMVEKGELDECVGVELQEALSALGEVLGEKVDEEVLDRIFSDFCVGK